MDPGVVSGGEAPDDLGRRLARRHLRRVERVTLEEDHLALGDGGVDLALGVPARILQDGVHPLVVVEPREVLRGGDIEHEEGAAERRSADVLELDPVALLADELVVLDESVPLGELAVGAHFVPEELLGGRDLGGGVGGEGAENEGGREGEGAEDAGGGAGGHGGIGGSCWRKMGRPVGRGGSEEYRRAWLKAAETAWNAGFSRHSGPQGRGRFVAARAGWTRSRAIPANEVVPPPACGGLCRLKPAFQAVRAVHATGVAPSAALCAAGAG